MFKKVRKLMNSLTFRIHLLKVFSIVLLFVLTVRIYRIQVTHSEMYVAFVNQRTSTHLQRNVARGLIFDRNLEVLVDNEAVYVIKFRHSPQITTATMRQTSETLAELISMPGADRNYRLTFRDLQDLFMITFPDEMEELLPKATQRELELSNAEFYELQLGKITEEHLELLTADHKRAHAIFIQMNQGTHLTANTIKTGATKEEIAIVSENSPRLSGIDVGIDWNRIYPSELGRSPIFGRVSDHGAGLPAERMNEYLAWGYERNDRVGLSQLERAYQGLLAGANSRYLAEGNMLYQLFEGNPGFQLTLTIDAELQQMIDDILHSKVLNARLNERASRHLREAYFVMMNPHTGEILSMNGVVLEEDESGRLAAKNNPLGAFQRAFTVGSTVKGASLLAGFYTGTTSIGQTRFDTPLIFSTGASMGSWGQLGRLNDIVALSLSSNVYFFLQTIAMSPGGVYQSGQRFWVDGPYLFDLYRNFFADFGLGVSTGIELFGEHTGARIPDSDLTPTAALTFPIGQADTYTTLQLAQYMSTIVANGNRFAAQIVRDVVVPDLDGGVQVLHGFTPNLLNTVPLGEQYFDRVKQGFRRTIIDGTGTAFEGRQFRPAGKTGTAEDYVRAANGSWARNSRGERIDVHTRTFVGFAPYDNPEIAFAIVIPQSELPGSTSHLTTDISQAAMEAYFNLQARRARES